MKTVRWQVCVYLFLAAGLTAFLAACGGGGGGDSDTGLTYTGLTTQAVITEDNAKTLAADTWYAGMAGPQLDIFGAVQAGPERNTNGSALSSLIVFLEGLGQQIVAAPQGTQRYVGAAVNETMPGSCNDDINVGYGTIIGTVNDVTGYIDVSVTFVNFCEAGAVVNGQAGMTGVAPNGDLVSFTLTFSEMTLEGLAVPTDSITLNGSFGFNYAAVPVTATMSYVVRDNILEKSYWLKDLVVELVAGETYTEITAMSGRFYAPDYGYVEISVGETIYMNDEDSNQSSGALILTGVTGTGVGTTWASLTFFDGNMYQVDADTTGDDVYDFTTGVENW